MKKYICLLLCLLMAVALIGCGPEEQLQEQPTETAQPTQQLPEESTEAAQAPLSKLNGAWMMSFSFSDGKGSFLYPVTIDSEAGQACVRLDSGDDLIFRLSLTADSEMQLEDDDGDVFSGAYEINGDTLLFQVASYATERKDRLENLPRLFWEEYKQRDPSHQVKLLSAQDFSEGLSWIQVVETTSEGYGRAEQIFAINTKGEVIYAQPQFYLDDEGWRFDSTDENWCNYVGNGFGGEHTPFAEGVSVAFVPGDQFLINSEGKEIWRASREGVADAVKRYGEGNVESVHICAFDEDRAEKTPLGRIFNGYSVVEMDINSFDFAGKVFGILGPDAEWVVEPEPANSMEIDSYGIVAAISENGTGSEYRNLKTGESFDRGGMSYFLDPVRAQEEGVPDWSGTLKDMMLPQTDGLWYSYDEKCFMNQQGEKVIDLSGYELWRTYSNSYFFGRHLPCFQGGYCVVGIMNKDGNAAYYTVYDKDGNQVMKPTKVPKGIDEHNDIPVISDGRILFDKLGMKIDGEEMCSYYTVTGEQITVPGYACRPYSCGLAVITSADRGSVWFADPDGNDAFPKP